MLHFQLNNTTTQDYLPVIYNLNTDQEEKALQNIIDEKKSTIVLHDEIESQMRELIKIRFPQKKLSEADYVREVKVLLDGKDSQYYGNWVYFPWNQKLVHVLAKEEFIELRTSRNLFKITPEERTILLQKKIGVIGLSVGQMIAMTIVMERICSEIRIADFDLIELSNMNRIRTSVSNISISKAVVAAREIAEIDPYMNVKIFTDGITEENIDAFFTEGGNLDVLVEECDGLDIKILSRIKARQLGIPVVMDTNDRGMLDIERFDLEPNRQLLHGTIPDDIKDLSSLRNLSNQEKLPLLGAMVGIENVSERMKLSLSEMGRSISTWPQLASSVVLGGAMVTDTCRRILLKQFQKSGRYYIDFDELIN